jgi:hypothetical protein
VREVGRRFPRSRGGRATHTLAADKDKSRHSTMSSCPLRPAKAKRADNTAALRQQRSRAKRKPSVTTPVNQPKSGEVEESSKIRADVTVSHPRTHTADSRNPVQAHQQRAGRHRLRPVHNGYWDQFDAATGGTLTDIKFYFRAHSRETISVRTGVAPGQSHWLPRGQATGDAWRGEA